jgi:uncharacterized membrane protein YfcA
VALAYLVLVVFLGFTVEAAAGFGATVVSVTLAAQAFPIDTVLAALIPVNLLLSGYVVAKHGRMIDRRLLGTRILPLMAVGMIAGIALSQSGSDARLKLGFAAFVVVLSAVELVGMRVRVAEARALPAVAGVGALLAGGVIHGIYACGGPLVVYFAGREIPDKARFRSTLSALWLVLNLVLVSTYVVGGRIDRASMTTSAVLLLPLAAGLLTGEKLHALLPEKTFRVAVFVLLLGAGTALLATSLV